MGSGGEIAGEVLFGHGSFAMCFLLSFRKERPSHNREAAPSTIFCFFWGEHQACKKRTNTAATCARVALSCGRSFPSLPLRIPSATAQRIASSA